MKRRFALCWLGLILLMCFSDARSVGGAQSPQPAGSVNLEQNKALVRRWIEEGFNRRNLKAVDDMFVEDFAVSGQRVGRAGLKQNMIRHFTAFPDLQVTIVEVVAEGDKVAIWYTIHGTQRGEFEGVRPTGKLVNWSGCDLLRVAEGRIVEGRFLYDSLGLMRQLGATFASPPGQK